MCKRVFLAVFLAGVIHPWGHAAVGDYVLGAGDVVRITVYQHDDLTTVARVNEQGNINFPLIGEMRVGGMTEREAEARVQQALQKGRIVQNPQVTLIIDQYQSHQVSVLGKVAKPGKYPFARGSTVVDLIAEAGGIEKDGSNRVMLTRKGKIGQPQTVDVAAILGGDASQNVVVEDGDIIFVPELEVFYVYGEVQRPGAYPLTNVMTVMQAISVSGGLTDKGTERGLKIKRRTQDGETQTITADLNDRLQPDDVILVKESLF
jgi:polysaccharide export outer membrane protein